MEHTQGEWYTKAGSSGMLSIYGIDDDDNRSICACGVDSDDRNKANADFICKAVNCHTKSLEACKKIQKLAVHASNDDKITLSGQLSGIWAMAEATIAAATE